MLIYTRILLIFLQRVSINERVETPVILQKDMNHTVHSGNNESRVEDST